MVRIQVEKKASNQSLYKFVSKVLKNAPTSFIHKLFRKKDVKVNGKREGKEYILKSNDEVYIYITDEQKKDFLGDNHQLDNSVTINNKLEIVYEDNNILIVNKPVNILSQKSKARDISLNDIIVKYIGKNYGFTPSIVNRLDRNTSGLIVAGKNYEALVELSRLFKKGLVDKYYVTIARGKINKVIDDTKYLIRDNLISKINNHSGQIIHTKITPIQVFDNYTYCKVKIFTGKTHQIRAHLSYLGHPIYGDKKYGADEDIDHHILHCRHMVFRDTKLFKKEFSIEIDNTEEIKEILRRL